MFRNSPIRRGLLTAPLREPAQYSLFSTPRRTIHAALLFVLASLFLFATLTQAMAQDGVLGRGDAVVTGFSGIKPADAPLPQGANPLDEFFIDRDGPSAQILSLAAPGEPPGGQLIPAPPKLQIKASQIGQVFAIALDDGLGAPVPSIYLGATLAYGAHIVLPDADGDGWAERARTGAQNAEWMSGQFGSDLDGGPGSIYRVNGQTGEPSLFATLPGNSGPGVGDIVFDPAAKQFFASDLDNGLIYRIGETGEVIDSFDHGVAGRPEAELAALPDDGKTLDIEDAGFDSENPATWAFTQEDRRVHGLAIRDGRLYYAVAGQVWSVGISQDGFGEDARWEFDAEGLPGDGPITDMLFDKEGRIYLAQRGGQRGSYDYSQFAEPEKSAVVRYRRETPDDPETESAWVAEPEAYAVGLPAEHHHAEGGIALGYPHDETGALRYGACGEMLWSTGHRLRQSALAEDGVGEGDADVHGLQGNAIALVRPENVPPQNAYFADYDGFFGDAAKSGHVGDVEIWQPCESGFAPTFGQLPPGIYPPGDIPPDFPPEFVPEDEFEANLRLTKRARPKLCAEWFGGWLCRYQIRISNTGPDDYFGPVLVRDWLPANPPGAVMGFAPTPPWTCWNSGPSEHRCFRPGVFLAPGWSIDLTAYAWVPKAYDRCNLRNRAAIEWAPGGSPWNSDPFDDEDGANALIPNPNCKPGERTDLKIDKRALLPCFAIAGNKLRCGYRVTVENNGPGAYNGDIVVDDIIPNNTTAQFSLPAGWNNNCPLAGNTHRCTYPNANLPNPGDDVSFIVRIDLTKERARELGCKVRNRAEIIEAPSPSPQNTDPTNDQASAVADVPEQLCHDTPSTSDLKIYKRALSCYRAADGPRCAYRVTVRNLGLGDYEGDIKVEDTIPAGMTAAFSGNGWACAGASPTYECTYANASLTPGQAVGFIVRVDFTPEQARQNQCRIRNRVEITQAPGGAPNNTDPANDTASAVGHAPASLCERRTNLKIEKIASPKLCTRSGEDWWCSYAIRVINTGPGVYSDPIELDEALPGEPLDAQWNAPWTCQGLGGGGGGAVCKHPNAAGLNPNSARILNLRVKFSGDLVKEKNCGLANVVKIMKPVPGSPKNTNPGDDMAADSALVPAEFCVKEPTNLQLTKRGAQPECNTTGGGLYRCPFNVIVKNMGPGKYDGPITVQDNLPPAAAGATMQVTNPAWVCIGAAPSITCKHPAVQLDPGQEVVMPVNVLLPPAGYGQCALTNTATILQAPGGTVQNQNAGDDTDSATLQFPPLLAHGQSYCHTPVPSTACPPGFSWNGERCDRIGIVPPVVTTPDRDCPAGFSGRYPNCKPVSDPDPDPDPERECPRGTVGNYPNCRKVADPGPDCSGGRILRRGKCVCRARLVWNGERCVRRECPAGTRGVFPNCTKVVVDPPRKCPAGTIGRFPNCRKVERPCPPGTVGKRPNCRKIVQLCPPGMVGKPPRCRKIERPCPPGTVGKRPNCRRIGSSVPNLRLIQPGGNGRPSSRNVR